MMVAFTYTYHHTHTLILCTDPTSLKVKYDNFDQADWRGAFLQKGLLAPFPRCVALVQLVILLISYTIASVLAIICMMGHIPFL